MVEQRRRSFTPAPAERGQTGSASAGRGPCYAGSAASADALHGPADVPVSIWKLDPG